MLIQDIAQLLLTDIKQRSTLVLAIDGRCAAGKTTLAARLAELCDCNVIHMDHFFLCSKQNTMERLQQAGGNMDYVRFCEEILIPLHEGRKFSYRPFCDLYIFFANYGILSSCALMNSPNGFRVC